MTLPFVEIDGLCAAQKSDDTAFFRIQSEAGRSRSWSCLAQDAAVLAKSDSLWQGQHSEAFLEDRPEPLGLLFMKRSTSVGLTWFSANFIASMDSTLTPKYSRPAECVSRIVPSPITPQEC